MNQRQQQYLKYLKEGFSFEDDGKKVPNAIAKAHEENVFRYLLLEHLDKVYHIYWKNTLGVDSMPKLEKAKDLAFEALSYPMLLSTDYRFSVYYNDGYATDLYIVVRDNFSKRQTESKKINPENFIQELVDLILDSPGFEDSAKILFDILNKKYGTNESFSFDDNSIELDSIENQNKENVELYSNVELIDEVISRYWTKLKDKYKWIETPLDDHTEQALKNERAANTIYGRAFIVVTGYDYHVESNLVGNGKIRFKLYDMTAYNSGSILDFVCSPKEFPITFLTLLKEKDYKAYESIVNQFKVYKDKLEQESGLNESFDFSDDSDEVKPEDVFKSHRDDMVQLYSIADLLDHYLESNTPKYKKILEHCYEPTETNVAWKSRFPEMCEIYWPLTNLINSRIWISDANASTKKITAKVTGKLIGVISGTPDEILIEIARLVMEDELCMERIRKYELSVEYPGLKAAYDMFVQDFKKFAEKNYNVVARAWAPRAVKYLSFNRCSLEVHEGLAHELPRFTIFLIENPKVKVTLIGEKINNEIIDTFADMIFYGDNDELRKAFL